VTRFPPTLLALLLILITASLSAAAVNALAARPRGSAAGVLTAIPEPQSSPTVLTGSIPGPLDGQPTPRQRAEREPVAAMIDNFTAARPQAGIGRASVVYEAPVEAGITRLMAVFLEHDAPSLGPVRSARPYFLDWALPYHPLFVHDGGSPAAQRLVTSLHGLINVDVARTGTTFHRIRSRPEPHDLFTGTPAVQTLARLRNWQMPGKMGPIPHRGKTSAAARPTAKIITVRFNLPGVAPAPDYTVSYRYDPANNSYRRSVGGAPSVDALTGRQVLASNVVVLVTTMTPIPNDPLGRIAVRTTGSGKATVFQGGRAVAAKWEKASRAARLRLVFTSGSDVPLNPGATWFEVISPGSVRVG
jgi:hypothetical protein